MSDDEYINLEDENLDSEVNNNNTESNDRHSELTEMDLKKESITLKPIIPVSDRLPSWEEEEELLQYLQCGCNDSGADFFNCSSPPLSRCRKSGCQDGMKRIFEWYFGRLEILASKRSYNRSVDLHNVSADCLLKFCQRICDPNLEHRYEHRGYIYKHLKQELLNALRGPTITTGGSPKTTKSKARPVIFVPIDECLDQLTIYDNIDEEIMRETIRQAIKEYFDDPTVGIGRSKDRLIRKEVLFDYLKGIAREELVDTYGYDYNTISNWINRGYKHIETTIKKRHPT